MIRLLGRCVALGVLGALVVWGLSVAPSPVFAAASWLVFGYLLRSAWSQIKADAQWVGQHLRIIPTGRYAGAGRSRRGDL